MVMFLSPPAGGNQSSHSVDELIEKMAHVDRFDNETDKYLYIAESLQNTGGEISYLERYLKDFFSKHEHFEYLDGFGDSTVVLGGTEKFRLRLVKWLARDKVVLPNTYRVGLTYDYAHNHDFNIVTKGIWGDGYETEVYRYNAEQVFGAVGEEVELEFQGRFKLSPGAVMWYEKYHDVHNQLPPRRFSMSLNVIPIEYDLRYPQLAFDLENKRVAAYTRNRQSRILSVMTLLADIDQSADTRTILEDAAQSSRNDWLKRSIAAIIADRWNEEFRDILDKFSVSAGSGVEVAAEQFSIKHIT